MKDTYEMQGQCLQYYNRECDLTVNEKSVLINILDHTFARKKRYAYMKYDFFDLTNRNTLKKTLDSLVDKGLISYRGTYNKNVAGRGQNEYRLLEPKDKIRNFIFTNDDK